MRINNHFPGVLLFPILLVLPFPLIVDSIALALALLNIVLVGLHRRELQIANGLRAGGFLIAWGAFVLALDWVAQVLRDGSLHFAIRESRISFLLIPLVICLAYTNAKQMSRLISLGLIIGVFLYILYAYGFLLYFYGTQTHRSFGLNHYLIYDLYHYLPGAYHHTYLGMYFTMAVLFAMDRYRQKRKSIWILAAVFIIVNQVFMGGKVTLAMSIVVLTYHILGTGIITSTKRIWALLAAVLFSSLLGYLIMETEVWKTVLFSYENRKASWECSIEIIKEHWLAGIGNGGINQYLESCVDSEALSSHNQYLEELVYYGILGFWLPVFLIASLRRARGDRVYVQFLVLIIILALSENILSVQRGILFFVFYNTVLYLKTFNEKASDLSLDHRTSQV